MADEQVLLQAEVHQSDNLEPLARTTSVPINSQDITNFQKEVVDFQTKQIRRLSRINQGWNIGLTAAGITCTLLTTVLGVVNVNNDRVQGWVKVGTGALGAVAVATQSIANQFGLKGKAGNYKLIEAEATVLAHKVRGIKTEVELQALQQEFWELILKAAQTESETENRVQD